ncbi:daf-6 [Cordylochernes scorpioides]|uniref:Daf-6 n=1 Tax=Cordylochernes scorpioides TaxID=51811 RepID=A0ABY6K776_9ARAC|nr:daf-6 [Cordylochernes scorpioides]
MKLNGVQKFVGAFFERLARATVARPLLFICIPALVTISLGMAVFIYKMPLEINNDPEYLYSPFNGRARVDRAAIEDRFPPELVTDPTRKTRFGKFGRVIVEPRDGGSVLRDEILQDVLKADKLIQEISINGSSYRDICARNTKNECYPNVILSKLEKLKAGNIRYPIEKNGFEFNYYGNVLGGVELDSEGKVKSAKVIGLMYYMKPDSKLSEEWEKKFIEYLGEIDLPRVNLYRYASSTLQETLSNDAKKAPYYFSFAILILMTFCVLTCTMFDCVQSKPLLGLLGSLSSSMAVGAALSLMLLLGVEFISINLVIPFVLLGIGMDDTFVLLAAWRRTERSQSLEKRLSEAYKHAGVSITVTSLTNMTSFLITFFGGCMTYCIRAEHNNLHALTCRPAVPRSRAGHHSKLFQLLCTGGQDPANPDHPLDNKAHAGMVFFRDVFGKCLSLGWVKCIIILVFGLYLAGAGYGCSQIQEGLELSDLFGDDSYATNFTLKETAYLNQHLARIQIVIDQRLDYSDPKVQADVEYMLQHLESSRYIADSSLTESWLRAFREFAEDPRSRFWTRGFNLTNKADFIRCLRFVFFKFPPASRYKGDIIFNDNYTEIIATRYFTQTNQTRNSVGLKNAMQDVQGLIDSMPFKAHSYNPFFLLLDMYVMIWDLTLQAVCVTAVVMMIVTFFFIPEISCSIWVAFSIVSIEIGVMGYLSLWGVNLNSTSLVCLIMCVGFSVDNAAHIAYAYVSTDIKEPNKKMTNALYFVGLPIFQACGSTIIGVLPLFLAPSYNFSVLAKTISLVMLFAGLHSMILLPVLFTIFGNLRLRSGKSPSLPSHLELPEKEAMMKEKVLIDNNNEILS